MWTKRWGVLGAIFVLLLLIATVLARFWFVPAVNNAAETVVQEKINGQLSWKEIELTPSYNIRLREIELKDIYGRDVLKLPELTVEWSICALMRSFFDNGNKLGAITKVILEQPTFIIVKEQEWNFKNLIKTDDNEQRASFYGRVIIKGGRVLATVNNAEIYPENVNGQLYWDDEQAIHGAVSFLYNKENLVGDFYYYDDKDFKGKFSQGKFSIKLLENIGIALPESLKDIKNVDGELHLQTSSFWCKNGVLTYHLEGALQNVLADYKSYHISNGSCDFNLYNNSIYVKKLAAKVNGQWITGTFSADWIKETSLYGDFHLNHTNISDLFINETLTGNLSGDIHVSYFDGKTTATGMVYGKKVGVGENIADEVRGGFSWDGENFQVISGELYTGNGYIVGNALYHSTDNTFTIDAYAKQADLKNIVKSIGIEGIVTGQISLQGNYTDTIHLLSANGDIQGENIRGFGIRAQAVSSKFSYNEQDGYMIISSSNISYKDLLLNSLTATISKLGDNYYISSLDGRSGAGSVHVDGVYSTSHMDLNTHVVNIDLEPFSSLVGINMSGAGAFKGTLNGNLEHPVLSGRVYATDGEIHGVPYNVIQGNLLMTSDEIIFDSIHWKDNKGMHVVTGAIGLKNEKKLNLQINSSNIRIENILKAGNLPYEVTGWVDNDMTITGTIDMPIIDGDIVARNGSVMGELFQSFSTHYSYKNGQLSLNNGMGNIYDSNILLHGNISSDALDLEVNLTNVDVRRILQKDSVDGKVTLHGHVSGNITSPRFIGTVESEQLKIGDAYMKHLSAQVEYFNQVLFVNQGIFQQGTGSFTWKGSINIESGVINGVLQFSEWDISEIAKFMQVSLYEVSGIVNGNMHLSGDINNLNVDLLANIVRGQVGETLISEGKIDLSYKNKALMIRSFRIPVGSGLLAAKGFSTPDGELDIQVAAKDMDISWIPRIVGKTDTFVKGHLTAGVKVNGTVDKPNAEVSIGIDNPSYDGTDFDKLFIMGTVADGKIFINQGLATKGPYKASVSGSMPISFITRKNLSSNIPFNLSFNLDHADLNLLAMLSKSVAQAEGPIHGQLKVTGDWDDPLLTGNIIVKNGNIILQTMKEPLSGINGAIDFNGKSMNVNVNADVGGGVTSAKGTIGWNKGKIITYNGEAHLHAPSIKSVYYTGSCDADFTVEDLYGTPELKGNIIIHDATIDVPLSLESDDNSIPLAAQIDITIGDKVKLYNSLIYDLVIKGNIKIDGLLSEPITTGRVDILQGNIHYLSNVFNVSEGYAIWGGASESLLPVVHLKANSKVSNYKIAMKLNGVPGDFKFELSSEPILNDSQIVMLLTTNTDLLGKNEEGLQNALFNAGLQMVFNSSGVQTYVKELVGLDYINITSSLMDGYEGVAAQHNNYYYIKIGKYLFNDFMLMATTGINNEQKSVGFHYDLKSRVGISAWYNSNHDTYIGADWKFNF